VSISTDLIQHYPWLPSLEKVYSNLASMDPLDFIVQTFTKYSDGELEKRISKLFKAAFENLERIKDYKADELNIYLYLIVKILLYILENKPISNRIANLYSKHTYTELLLEKNDANLYDICQDLKILIEYYPKPLEFGIIADKDQREVLITNFKIHYIDYLKLAANLRDEYRKLVHNPLYKGYIFIERKSLIRLLQEYVRRKLIGENQNNNLALSKFRKKVLEIKELKELYENILHEWELKKEEFEYSFEVGFQDGADLSKSFPPCIREILIKIQEGQNIIHIERLYLVFFLHALNYPNDYIINLFSKLPDFDQKKTEYQVNFAKKKGYTPHSCSTLKSYNLCKADKYKDEICLQGYYSKKLETQKPLTHPLFYVQLKQYRSYKNQTNKIIEPLK